MTQNTSLRPEKLRRFMRQALFNAQEFSKDASTKVGALFLDPEDYTQYTQGYNGMPRGTDESKAERHERPLKYSFYEHAERNAIFNLARAQLKGSLAITTRVPSTSCARALVSVGVSEVYFPTPGEVSSDLQVALALFAESGVTVHHTFGNSVLGMQCRKGRKLAKYVALANALPSLLSKDPNGDATLFLDPQDYTQLTQGYSGMPRGADDSKVERYEGELRERWVEGSVRNAIYNLVRPKLKGSVAVVTATTCVECARAIAGVGAAHVVYKRPDEQFLSRWGSSIQTALDMLAEMNIQTTQMTETELGS